MQLNVIKVSVSNRKEFANLKLNQITTIVRMSNKKDKGSEWQKMVF